MGIKLFFNNNQESVEPGLYLHEYAERFGIHVPTSCNRQGKCKECLVEISEGMELLSQPAPQEMHLLNKTGIPGTNNKFRLSCRTQIIKDSGVIRCSTLRRGNMKIETKALKLPLRNYNLMLDPAAVRKDKGVYLNDELIDSKPGQIYGLAVDLGTTTVVVYLVNLETGEIAAESAFENPQRFGGSDIMARIHYDTEHKDKLLQRTLAGYLTHAIEEFPVDPSSIYEAVIAGNSTMRDIFFRMNVYTIGQNPYRSITEIEKLEGKRSNTSLSASPKRLNLPLHPKAQVYSLPIISGHVGADAAACMLAVDIAHEERLTAIMDIGTNTEIILGNKNKILAASCPAGPAFEGGNISCGMPALSGAIEKFKINPDGRNSIKVIDEIEPQGICGSGLIDVLSELLKNNLMNNLGRFIDGESEFTVYSGNDYQIKINEKDINELAQAKGANVAGLHIIFKNYGISFKDIDIFYIAGGFGRHINIESAKRIGLIPDIDDSKILQIGNASIEGASIALLSKTKRCELEKLVENVKHCRLETDPLFFNYFVEGCQFNLVESLDNLI
ncbi:MAG TPA: ASKHA domain-containing protein [Ignavibacteriaceae bacterium]|nr:ASKHA domain-containing protein [Ignavibacteriaceae bacterium]